MSDPPGTIAPGRPAGGRFDGLVALVTGGSGGIGRAVCRRLLDAGCAVVATGATEEEVSAARDDPDLAGATVLPLDVGDPRAVSDLIGGFDQLDVLVNLAGIGRGAAEFSEEGFARTVEVNLLGTMRTCYAARDLLGAGGGSIVNTASMMSFFGSGTAPAYAASKGGVAQLTKSLAIAWGPLGIRVNAVAPGWIDTPMTVPLRAEPGRDRAVISRTPLGRWGTPADVAEGVCFLAAPSSAFVTGVVLPVDGGYLVT